VDIVNLLVGLVLLLAAGDLLVRGAVALSLRLGIPALIVGLTVVAFGTSAPELLISIQAALDGAPGIAVGNVVGSNIANVLLVLGLPALFAAITPSREESRRSYLQMLAASFLLIGLCALGPLHFWHAAVLLGLFALMLTDMVREGRKHPGHVAEDVQTLASFMSRRRMTLFLALGIIGLPVGARYLIAGAVGLSREFGISEEVIGLTIVAIGTSLPELATTLMATIRRHGDVAVGNVIGSNLFNILSILGFTSLFGPIPIAADFLARDLWVMLGCALLLGIFVLLGRPVGRMAGVLFLVGYAGYLAILVLATGSAA
jgi:cation:H+ antiporter